MISCTMLAEDEPFWMKDFSARFVSYRSDWSEEEIAREQPGCFFKVDDFVTDRGIQMCISVVLEAGLRSMPREVSLSCFQELLCAKEFCPKPNLQAAASAADIQNQMISCFD